MSNLNQLVKIKLEALFNMNSGFVLDFSNKSFSEFIRNAVNKNIDDKKYQYIGSSKASITTPS